MKKTTILFISLALMVISIPNIAIAADFTTGNIVVLRVGDGSAVLSSAATASFLDEYTPTGTLVQSIANPTSGDNMITSSGTAGSEGALSLSPDGVYLTFAGYNAAIGTASIKGTTAAVANRIALSYDKKLAITSIKSATAYSGDNFRSAIRNENHFWGGGTSSGAGTNGVQYLGTGTAVQVSSTVTNVRVVNIFNGQLYFSTGSGTRGIYKVGSGLPTITGETSVAEISIGTAESPYSFSFNSSSNICYVADDRSIASGGGIMKYTKTDGIWSRVYTLASGTVGAVGLTVDWSGANPIIYATTTNNKVIKIEDTGASSVSIELIIGTTNTAFRGIAFAPTKNSSTGFDNPKSNSWTLSNNTLSFTELPSSKIDIFTLTGSKVAVYEPAKSIDLKLSKGIYILKVDNQSSKIVLN